MSKKATEFQKREMSKMYRGKEIFKPLNTGWVDERVACVREWVANIFFYRKGDTTIMIDAGYNYDRLAEKMGWLGIDPQSIRHILITHQDTDHVKIRVVRPGKGAGSYALIDYTSLPALIREAYDRLYPNALEEMKEQLMSNIIRSDSRAVEFYRTYQPAI